MSGDLKLVEQLDQILDDYVNLKIHVPEDISNYFNLTRDQIERLSSSQGFEIASILMGYAITLQQQENREKARISWCESYLNSLCAKHWDDFDKWLPKEIKIAKIAGENEMVSKFYDIIRQSTARFNEIVSISNMVRYYSGLFFEIGKKR